MASVCLYWQQQRVTRAKVDLYLARFWLLIIFCAFTFPVHAADIDVQDRWSKDYSKPSATWYNAGVNTVKSKSQQFAPLGEARARNVILFVGDGMGVSTITAARIFAGQQQGLAGEEYQLSFDRFPITGLARTYNTNQQTPDSAGTITALITGVKTRAGMLSVGENARRKDCLSQSGNNLFTALELAEISGMATGVVSTARITHATPGATYAKTVERDWESDAAMTQAAREEGCEDIASQLVSFRDRLNKKLQQRIVSGKKTQHKLSASDGIEVMLGGGWRNFVSSKERSVGEGVVVSGQRKDGRNLLTEWQRANPDGDLVYTRKQLLQSKSTRLLGLFSASHMAYDAQRRADTASATQPSLAEMTGVAIDRLSKAKNGFFLMVEAGRIDHAHHAGSAFHALSDTVALSDAVALAVQKTDVRDTLIIVTADHSHVFTMAGYPVRGNPILGKVRTWSEQDDTKAELAVDANGLPYTTLGYSNGRGASLLKDSVDADDRYDHPITPGRHSLKSIDTGHAGYHQESLVPLSAETHGGEDVAVFAMGPGAVLLSGSNEQNVIFHVMKQVARLGDQAPKTSD